MAAAAVIGDLIMTPERWRQTKELLAAVIEQPTEKRRAYIDERVNGDEELRAEIESLLAHEEAGDSIVDSPKISSQLSLARVTDEFLSASLLEVDASGEEDELKVSRVGPYRIIRELGRGGVGSVFLGERDDDAYRQQVAIKLIRRGMDTEFVVRRFRNERQILAALEHPNIARLLDGGTTENDRPYLVMEYVEGAPIDVYCDQHQLGIDQRLNLIQQVCAAVHYAHQHLVIHRDIKPSNILVTNEGVPKLLDFGIAKLLTPELAAQTLDPTMTSMRLLTPAYASPEQIKGQPITTATDVYSLGVLLHELLAGHKPYRVDSRVPLEIMQAVLKKEATKPSTAVMATETTDGNGAGLTSLTPESVSKARSTTPDGLRRRLRGDLDNIVLTAVRKDPQRRYASVQQFSEDISRHLKGLPVIARADTFGYRAAKFIKRNKVAVASAAIVLVMLVAGIIAINQQRQLAERRFNDVRQLARAVVFDYHDAIADLPGSTAARQRMVKDALEYLDNLSNDAAGDRSLQRELATAYQKIGDVQGNSNMANLGDTIGALASYRKSLQIREVLIRTDPVNPEWQNELADSYARIGDVLRTTGDVNEADKSYQQAINLLEKLSAANDRGTQRRLADLLYRVGNLKGYAHTSNLGDTTGAVAFHRRALAIREALWKAMPDDVNLRIDAAESHRSIANILVSSASNVPLAEPHAHRAVSIAQELVDQQQSNARALRVLTEAQDALARIRMIKGEADQALETCFESLRNAERLLAIDPKNMQARQDLASSHTLAGNIYARKGDTANALRHHHESLAMNQLIATDDASNKSARRWIGQNHVHIGTALVEAGDLANAVRQYRKAIEVFEALTQGPAPDLQAIPLLGRSYGHVGTVHLKLGDLQGALEHLRRSIELAEQAIARDSGNETMRRSMAQSHFNMGEVFSRLAGQRQTAETSRREHWLSSRQAYQRSLDLFLELRSRGTLTKEFAAMPEQIPPKIAACDAALQRYSQN